MEALRVIDGDGHLFEDADGISSYMPSPFREAGPWRMDRLIPPLDHLHVHVGQLLPGSFGGGKPVGPTEWSTFMSDVGIDAAVLYPTNALAYGKIVDLDWAIAVARGYNDWLYHTYLQVDPRFKGMALIPIQDPPAAVLELRRVVQDLGMRGTMLASTNTRGHVGAKDLWPVYEEADRLGCAVAFHGGCHEGFGLDDINVYAPVHALGHPYGQMNCLASVVFNGLMEKFPNVRWGFLEGGVAWLLLVLERFDAPTRRTSPTTRARSCSSSRRGAGERLHPAAHQGRAHLRGLRGRGARSRLRVKRVGSEPFIFSSDFPHEVNAEMCKHEMHEILESDDLSHADKEAIFAGNAKRFYRF